MININGIENQVQQIFKKLCERPSGAKHVHGWEKVVMICCHLKMSLPVWRGNRSSTVDFSLFPWTRLLEALVAPMILPSIPVKVQVKIAGSMWRRRNIEKGTFLLFCSIKLEKLILSRMVITVFPLRARTGKQPSRRKLLKSMFQAWHQSLPARD